MDRNLMYKNKGKDQDVSSELLYDVSRLQRQH